ncbi:MAG: hypothetical protein K2J26_05860, partial [Ruminococcus sp.]|nr:hypothetical protein [Ruminococcus sp.]
MSDLYLKVTNDINEDVLLCYIYSNTGACYGLKYSPDSVNQLSVVVLNSRQTEIESEQTGAENHPLSKDDLIHIYIEPSQGIGGFLVSSIHNGVEVSYPSLFILQAKDGSGRVDFDSEPFSFAGLKSNNFSESSNSITKISSDEYESKLSSTEQSSENETNTSEDQEAVEGETCSQESSALVTNSITTTTTALSHPAHEKSNGKIIIGIVIIVAMISAIVFLLIKLNAKNKVGKGSKRKRNHTANNMPQAPIDTNFIDCQIINQSICCDNKRLLAHSLFKGEDFERIVDVKLASYNDFEYYRDQNASRIKYRKLYSSAKVPESEFIIGMTNDWELVIAQHNNHLSITLDIFNTFYLEKTERSIEWIY